MSSESQFTIRRALPSEINLVREVRRYVFTEEQGIPAALDHDGLDETSIHALAFSEDTTKAIACGRLTIHKPYEAIIARIAVLKEYRGASLGKRIIECLEQEAKQKGIKKIELHPHKHLFDFYQSLGYAQTIDPERVVAGHTLLTMNKTW